MNGSILIKRSHPLSKVLTVDSGVIAQLTTRALALQQTRVGKRLENPRAPQFQIFDALIPEENMHQSDFHLSESPRAAPVQASEIRESGKV